MPRIPALSAVAAVIAGLAAPGSAGAAQTGYVVTLRAELGAPCSAAIGDVRSDYAITTSVVYTDSICGFAAPLSKAKARDLAADPRVQSVAVDGQVTAA
jgi:hypothetical protein